ncbi:hypothetical protein CR513_26734, partial [Mucuna pruriens]
MVQETTLVIDDNVYTIILDIVPERDYNEDGIGLTEDDPINFSQTMQSSNSKKWIHATKDELKSMQDNHIWDLVELPEVAKGFIQKEDIDYKETFSPVSSKDSFRTKITLVAHFDLELHHMAIKTAFLNGDIDEMIYMMQLENFVLNESESMTSHQWYHKFYQVITSYDFEANIVDDYEYHKFSGSKYIFLILYVDDILLGSSDTCLLHETKRFLMKNFEKKDLGEASFIPRDTPIAMGDKFSLKQCPNNDLERNDAKDSLCLNNGESNICSSLYSSRHYSCGESFEQHWKTIKRVMHYLKRIKAYMLTYQKSEGVLTPILVRGAISWKSIKQTLIAHSTIAVEFVTRFKAPNHGRWLQNFVTKRVQNKQICIEHVGTSFMLVDPLIKGKIPKAFHE